MAMAFALGLVMLALMALVGLFVGSRNIPLPEVLAALLSDRDSDDIGIVRTQRIPRTLLAIGVGVALGCAGALMQGHTRNPLADPGLFGVNAGAAFAVSLVVFVSGSTSPVLLVSAALIGAAAVTLLVMVGGLRGARTGTLVMLAVVGTTIAALLDALTTSLQLFDGTTLDVARFWQAGSVNLRDLSLGWVVGPLLGIGLILSLHNGFALNALTLGEDVARSLGQNVRRSRIIGIAAITLLAGGSTAMCGPIAFLGLVAPHAARAVTGPDYRWLVPLAGVCGAILLLIADVLGRLTGAIGEVQAGIMMAAVGAPILLAITRRRRLVAL